MQRHSNLINPQLNKLKSFGIAARLVNNKLLVYYIYIGSPAEEAGISLDDQIVFVNEKNYSNISWQEYCNIFHNGLFPEDLNEVEMVFRKGNDEKSVHLKKRVLLWKDSIVLSSGFNIIFKNINNILQINFKVIYLTYQTVGI